MRKPKATTIRHESKAVTALIDRIDVPPDRQREFQPAVAEAIAATLSTLGLIQPIGIAAIGERYRLVYGRHRLEAARKEGWECIPALLLHLDETNLDASAALHEAMENLLRADLKALDRMAHLAALKAAHDKLYPEASKAGRPKKMTRAAEENLDILPKFSFSKTVAEYVGLDRRSVNRLTSAWGNLSLNSRLRLRGSRLADRQSELLTLANLEPIGQSRVLDHLLSDPPDAATVEEAWAIVMKQTLPTAEARRAERYVRTLKEMSGEDRDAILELIESEMKDFARRKGWLA